MIIIIITIIIIYFAPEQKKKKGKYEFEEYLRNQVIDKKTVLPLYKVIKQKIKILSDCI